MESTLHATTEGNTLLSTKLSVLQGQHEEVLKGCESSQAELKLCKTQLEGVRQLMVQKENEKEVGVAISLSQTLLKCFTL